MISSGDSTAREGVVHFSWGEIGSGDIATQLGKLTGPCVQKMDLATRTMNEFNDQFDKFIAAAQSQGTMELLKGSGPFTLLVPVDSSVTQNVDTKAHILNGKFSLEDLAAGGSAQTLAGTTVQYEKPLKIVKVGDASVKAVYNAADHRGGKLSTAFPFDVECTNGVIHAIDMPLVATNEPLSAQASPAPATKSFEYSSAPVPASFDESMMSRGAGGGGGAPLQKLGPDGVWGMEAKKRVFDAWDPEKPRDYNNFNPFERNNEGSICDVNGCFPGQSKGYQSPLRPDQSWEIMQKEQAFMDELKKDPKFQIKGKPGNFNLNWQEKLGRPPAP
jgi:uncharacterized surface protein with fasciclin (FAS1) repeats